jgi:lysylphosphatidylglycerol synthetase-like protein (DUF2156 family)
VSTQSITAPYPTAGQTDAAPVFRKIKLLAAGYLGLSVLTLGAIALMRHHPAEVNSSVWTHGIAVAVSAVVANIVAVLAARGSRAAYRRLRIVSVILVAAITVFIALPDGFPLWMKADQSVAGLLWIAVAVLANGRQLRSRFADE